MSFELNTMFSNQEFYDIGIVTSLNTTSLNAFDKVSALLSNLNMVQKQMTLKTHNVHTMDFSFEKEDLADDELKVTIGTKYFRFTTKFSLHINRVFLLATNTFEETVVAIRNSGFETLSDALYVVLTIETFENSGYLINPFQNVMSTSEESFNTVVVFLEWNYNQQKRFSILCYTCPSTAVNLIKTSQFNLNNFKAASHILHKNGNKRLVPLRGSLAYIMDDSTYSCLSELEKLGGRVLFYQSFNKCGIPFAMYSSVAIYLNITLTMQSRISNEEELIQSKWWFNVGFGESMIMLLPNHFAQTRGMLTFTYVTPLKSFVCFHSTDLKTFSFLIFGIIETDVWICVVFAISGYSLVYRKLKEGTNFLLKLIGIPTNIEIKHKRFWDIFSFGLIL